MHAYDVVNNKNNDHSIGIKPFSSYSKIAGCSRVIVFLKTLALNPVEYKGQSRQYHLVS